MQTPKNKTVNNSFNDSRLGKTGRRSEVMEKKIRKAASKKNAANFLLATYRMIEVT